MLTKATTIVKAPFFQPWLRIGTSLSLLAGCSATQINIHPAVSGVVCAPQLQAHAVWSVQWRADQKEPALREAAAQRGLEQFFHSSECFAKTHLQRVALAEIDTAVAHPPHAAIGKTLSIVVRELGPVLRVGASLALIDGGTEVVMDVQEFIAGTTTPVRSFRIQRLEGGPGVVRGASALDQDVLAALRAGLKPALGAPTTGTIQPAH